MGSEFIHHDDCGCLGCSMYGSPPPSTAALRKSAVPTITIPVAEYEGLKRRAGFFTAEGVDWHQVIFHLNHDIDGGWKIADALTAAIKEQEG